jgi:hypothetical protein
VPLSGQEPSRRAVDGWKVTATGPELGVSGVAVADEEPRPNGGVLPLLVLFIALAVATVWFVVLPALDKPKPPMRSCATFIVSKSGSARCVDLLTPAAQSPGAQPSTPWP